MFPGRHNERINLVEFFKGGQGGTVKKAAALLLPPLSVAAGEARREKNTMQGCSQMEWEYAALFDVEERTPLENWWIQQPTRITTGKMGYRTRTIKSGPMLEVEVYPIFGRSQERTARKAKTEITKEAMERHNLAAAKRRIVRLANCNFGRGDIHCTLTYSQAPSFEQAQKDIRNFLRRLKRIREKRGLPELKYIYAIEDNEDGQKKRIHAHCLLSGGVDREEIEALWAKGFANCDRLKPDENGLEALARYIVKSTKNRRKWCCSKNLKKPKVRTSDTKLSNRRVQLLSVGIENQAKEILRKAWPGYEYVELKASYSDRVDGVYLRGKMRKIE